jgi:hypothetical protein
MIVEELLYLLDHEDIMRIGLIFGCEMEKKVFVEHSHGERKLFLDRFLLPALCQNDSSPLLSKISL